jgi:cell division septation protein DedD
MVEQAFGRADSRNGTYAAVQPAVPLAESGEFFEGCSLVAERFEEAQPTGILFGLGEELKFNPFGVAAADVDIHTSEAHYATAPDSAEPYESRDEIFPQSIASSEDCTDARDYAERDYAEKDDSNLAAPSTYFPPEVDVASAADGLLVKQNETRPSSLDQPEADALESPLQAPEYSHEKWPVLISPANRRSIGRLRTPLIAMALLAFVAGSFFLIRAATNITATGRSSAVGEPTVSSAKPPDIGAQNQSQSLLSPTPPNAEPSSQKSVFDQRDSGENRNAQGGLSLQAAAFPTEAGAEEFAGKLRRARVPSYVVPADLARRGKWFRVRIGRFNSAEDAQRFAGEAQLRARTAGVTLQLIVCQYEQP